jgi:hypothetical protein
MTDKVNDIEILDWIQLFLNRCFIWHNLEKAPQASSNWIGLSDYKTCMYIFGELRIDIKPTRNLLNTAEHYNPTLFYDYFYEIQFSDLNKNLLFFLELKDNISDKLEAYLNREYKIGIDIIMSDYFHYDNLEQLRDKLCLAIMKS